MSAASPIMSEVGAFVDSIRKYLEAGFDHLYFHQIGPDQKGFIEFAERELLPALGDGAGR